MQNNPANGFLSLFTLLRSTGYERERDKYIHKVKRHTHSKNLFELYSDRDEV